VIRRSLVLLLVLAVLLGASIAATTTVVVWDRVQQTEKLVDLFNQEMETQGKDIRATFELVPYDQQVSKFMAALAAGRAPDVYSLDLIQFPYFVHLGAFKDITTWFEQQEWKDELPAGMLKLGIKDEKVHALPYTTDLSVMMWNKDLFAEAGLDPESPPETWEEFIEYGKLLTKDTNNDGNIDQWASALVGTSAGQYMFWFMPFVWSNEGQMFDDVGNVVFDSPEAVEALQFWHDLIHKHEIAIPSSIYWASGDRYNAFIAGRAATFFGGNFNITSIMRDAPDLDFGVAPLPRGKGDFATFGGGNLIGITEQSRNPEAALEFLAFAMSDAMIEAFAPHLLLMPRPSLYDNPYYNEIPQMEAFAEILKYARTPFSFRYNEIYDPVLFYLQGALAGRVGVEEAVWKVHEEVHEIVTR